MLVCEIHNLFTRSLNKFIGRYAPPFSFRKPDFLGTDTLNSSFSDRNYKNIITEKILVLINISFLTLRIFIIQRTANRYTGIISFTGHSVEIGKKRVAKPYRLKHRRKIIKLPNSTFYACIVCRMCTENRCKHSELYPTKYKFRIIYNTLICECMSAKIVPPITIPYIRSCSRKIRLEAKSLKVYKSIARKTNLITMAAQASPTVENYRSAVCTFSHHIVKEYMIAPECFTQSVSIIACKMLLPVNPPEVNSLTFVITDDIFKE